jgi:hypothetical protein
MVMKAEREKCRIGNSCRIVRNTEWEECRIVIERGMITVCDGAEFKNKLMGVMVYF